MNFLKYIGGHNTGQDRLIALIILSTIFFFVYAALSFFAPQMFASPDETANYFFIDNFRRTGSFTFSEQLNILADGTIHPRSMVANGAQIVPGSFLGMPLIYGLLAKVFGMGVVPFLTPLFASISVVIFYLFLRKIFSESVSFYSSLLMYVLPPFWYYTSRGMFHNVFFICLCVCGAYFFAAAFLGRVKKGIGLVYSGTAGLFLGLAIATRVSEIFWVGLAVGILFAVSIVKNKKKDIAQWALFFVVLGLMMVLVVYIQRLVYGTALSSVYSSPTLSEEAVTSPDAASRLRSVYYWILPFGINISQIAFSCKSYIIRFFPVYSLFLLCGLVVYVQHYFLKIRSVFLKRTFHIHEVVTKNERLYFLMFVSVSLWMVAYYGSYQFNEFFDREKIILGSSYLRYWLPIYVFGLPIAVIGLRRVVVLVASEKYASKVLSCILIIFVALSLYRVLLDPLYGLVQTRDNLVHAQEQSEQVVVLTEENALIISGNADKLFFPKRKVMVALPDEQQSAQVLLQKLCSVVPVYYFYNPLSIEQKNELDELAQNFRLTRVYTFEGTGEKMYKISAY